MKLPYVGEILENPDERELIEEVKSKMLPRFPCFLCGDLKEIRIDKNKKPYFICDPCGTQAFIRGKRGIARMELFNNSPDFQKMIFSGDYLKTSEILRIQEQIEFTEGELERLDKFINTDSEIQLKQVFKQQLKNLRERLSKLIENR